MRIKCNLKGAKSFRLTYGGIYTVESEIIYKGNNMGFDYYIIKNDLGYEEKYLQAWFDIVDKVNYIHWNKVPRGIKVVYHNMDTHKDENLYFVKVAHCENLMLSKLAKRDSFSGLDMDDHKLFKFVNPHLVQIHPDEKIEENWLEE